MLTIKDLSVSNALDLREMSAVRGGESNSKMGTWCIDVRDTLTQDIANTGVYGVIAAAAIIPLVPACPE
jgi:hypothetical protein